MSTVPLIARLTAVDGKHAELAIRHVIATADEEDGIEVDGAHSVDDEPGVYHVFELYRDDEAPAADGKGDGIEVDGAHSVDDEPGVHHVFELYRDDEAPAADGKGDGMRAATGALGGLLAGRPENTMLTPIAAKGLEL